MYIPDVLWKLILSYLFWKGPRGSLYWVHDIRTGKHRKPASYPHHAVMNELKLQFHPFPNSLIRIVTNRSTYSVKMIYYQYLPSGKKRSVVEHMRQGSVENVMREYMDRYTHCTLYFHSKEEAMQCQVPPWFTAYDVELI